MNRKKGQALVEMALVLPFLLLIVIGIIEMGWLFHNQLTVQNLSREIARHISVGGSESEAVSKAHDVAAQLNQERISIVISPAASERTRGTSLKVRVMYEHQTITPFLSGILGSATSIDSDITMRME